MASVSIPDLRGVPVIDAAYLAAQTFADDGLQRDLLVLFSAQCDRLMPAIVSGGPDGERAIHTLRGAAGAIGARQVASVATAVEQAMTDAAGQPDVDRLVGLLAEATTRTQVEIAARLAAA